MPACDRGCRVRYTFRLRDAAESLDTDELAAAYHDLVQAPPGTWLLRPLDPRPGDRIRLRVHVPRGLTFATGLLATGASGSGTWEAPAIAIGTAPYTVFGR